MPFLQYGRRSRPSMFNAGSQQDDECRKTRAMMKNIFILRLDINNQQNKTDRGWDVRQSYIRSSLVLRTINIYHDAKLQELWWLRYCVPERTHYHLVHINISQHWKQRQRLEYHFLENILILSIIKLNVGRGSNRKKCDNLYTSGFRSFPLPLFVIIYKIGFKLKLLCYENIYFFSQKQ